MGMQGIRDGKLLYHLTRLDNFDSILEKGLLSRRFVKNNRISFYDVADSEIITKRTLLGLDDYIPFHFHPYSSFDVAVKSTYSDKEFIYICIKRDFARINRFKILPRHPLSVEECELLDYEDGFKSIDWDTMHTLGTDDEYTKHVKMAECLTDIKIYINCFQCIYVKSDKTKTYIQEKLKLKNLQVPPPFVQVQKWL